MRNDEMVDFLAANGARKEYIGAIIVPEHIDKACRPMGACVRVARMPSLLLSGQSHARPKGTVRTNDAGPRRPTGRR